MAHIALYRKYRSQTFDELIGQEHVIRTLQNGLSRGSIHHAFLFTGPRGTGKTSTARLLAKALNCVHGPTDSPCGSCDICTSIAEGSCIDVVEMDAASEAGVDEVRERIVDVIDYKPALCRYRVFIIDEVHDLSPKAFDALLKTIEEPPGHVVFVLATTEQHKVPPTIQSRTQKFNFSRASLKSLVDRMTFVLGEEGIEFEPAALSTIARMADGGFRDALSLLEQVMLTAEKKITLTHVVEQLGLVREEAIDSLLVATDRGDVAKILSSVDEIFQSGRDARSILESMLYRLSDLTRASYEVEIGAATDATQEAAMKAISAQLGGEKILPLRMAIAASLRDVRDVTLPKLWLESLLIGYASAQRTVSKVVAPPVVQSAVVSAPESAATPPVQSTTTPPSRSRHEPEPAKSSGNPEQDKAAQLWQKVRDEIGEMSKTARAKIGSTRVTGLENGVVTVSGFLRQNDYESFSENTKLVKAILAKWDEQKGDAGWTVQFVHTAVKAKADPGTPSYAAPAVELPAEGEKLKAIFEQEFQGK